MGPGRRVPAGLGQGTRVPLWTSGTRSLGNCTFHRQPLPHHAVGATRASVSREQHLATDRPQRPRPSSRDARKRRPAAPRAARGSCQARPRSTAFPALRGHGKAGGKAPAGGPQPGARSADHALRERPPGPPTSLLRGGVPSAGHAASAGLSFPSRDRGACRGPRPRIWGHRLRSAPGGGPRLQALRRDPGRRLPGLSFPVGARSPQAESERSRPPPRPGPHRQARHDLDRAAVAEVPSGVRRRLGHGHCRLLRAARPPRGARRRPFAAPLPADAPAHAHAHAHARHARHARRGVESARERGGRRARQARARATGAAEGQTQRGRLSRGAPGGGGWGPGLDDQGRGPGRGGGRVSLATRIGERLGARPGWTRRRGQGAGHAWGGVEPLLSGTGRRVHVPSCVSHRRARPSVPSPCSLVRGAGRALTSGPLHWLCPLAAAPQTPAWLSSRFSPVFAQMCHLPGCLSQ